MGGRGRQSVGCVDAATGRAPDCRRGSSLPSEGHLAVTWEVVTRTLHLIPAGLLVILALPGCLIDTWVGAGMVRPPGAETERVWTAGASAGLYLDRAGDRVRVAASAHTDKQYINAATVSSTRSSGYSSVRADLLLGPPESDETLHRLTGVVSWGGGDMAVMLDGVPSAPAATPVQAFLGLTRTVNDRERRNTWFSDAVTVSLGPYLSRWSLADGQGGSDPMWGAGGAVRFTIAVSPATVLGALGMMATESNRRSLNTPVASPASSSDDKPAPTPTTTCTTTTTCRTDSDGNQWCTPNTVCR